MLEILKTNCTDNQPNTLDLCSQKAIHLLPGEHGRILGRLGVGYGKSGMLENKSGNISEKRKDRGIVTIDGLQKPTNALSNGTIPDPLRPPLPKIGGLQPLYKTAIQNFAQTIADREIEIICMDDLQELTNALSNATLHSLPFPKIGGSQPPLITAIWLSDKIVGEFAHSYASTPCLKKTVQTYFLSEVCQISTDCKNFWHKDSRQNRLF